MKSLPSFALVVSLTAGAAWALAAPPGAKPGSAGGRQISQTSARQPLRLAQANQPEANGEKLAADKPGAEKLSGKDILKQCRDRMAQYSAFKADIVEKISVPERSFTATGSYLQGKALQLRMEFQVELAGTKGSLLQICDGQILWSQHTVGDQVFITRRDARVILDKAREVNVPQAALITEIGLGGLNGMLASIETSMDLKRIGTETIDDRAVTLLEGTWNKAFKEAWKGREMPPFVPDQLRLYIDQEQQFPRRIVYTREAGNGKPTRPLLVLDFTNVSVSAPVKDNDFLFVPPDSPAPVDQTKQIVERLTQAGQNAQPKPPAGAPVEKAAPAPKAATQGK